MNDLLKHDLFTPLRLVQIELAMRAAAFESARARYLHIGHSDVGGLRVFHVRPEARAHYKRGGRSGFYIRRRVGSWDDITAAVFAALRASEVRV